MSENRPLIVALDHDRADTALELAMRLDPGECRLKIAGTLFVRAGPPLIERLTARGFEVFLDLKFHDIPAQVAGACRSAADLGVWMLNVHAAGGAAMMRAALDALSGCPRPPLLTAVTVLTSLDGADLATLGLAGPPAEAALRLARLARAAGLDGVVCSAEDLARLRPELPEPFLMVTPGIRPERGRIDADDQKRVSTPQAALAAGASYLVVGRPVTQAGDPMAAVAAINAEIRAITRAP